MSATLWKASTGNGFSTTLDGTIANNDTSITLTTTTGLVAPGVLVIDRQNSDQVDTPNQREYITFTGISLNTLTGCSRGVAGSTAQGHSSGALVEETMSITHWNDLVEFLSVAHNSAGNILTSVATINDLTISGKINVGSASIIGNFPIHPVFVISGNTSGATTGVGLPLPMPQDGAFQFLSAKTRTNVSGNTLIIDINNNGTTVFSNQATRLMIPPSSSFISTASIGAKVVVAGSIITADIDSNGGSATDLTIMGRVA